MTQSKSPQSTANTLELPGGKDLGSVRNIWVKYAASEERLELLRKLVKLNIGFVEVQDYCIDLKLKFKSASLDSNSDSDKGVIREAMKLKLLDEGKYNEELLTDKNSLRREIHQAFGQHSHKSRSVIKYLRGEAVREKVTYKEKYQEKLEHLIEKYGKKENEELDKYLMDLRIMKICQYLVRKSSIT